MSNPFTGEFSYEDMANEWALSSQQGSGESDIPAGQVDDSWSVLGDNQTLQAFIDRQTALVQAHEATDNPAQRALISTQLNQLYAQYPGLFAESINVHDAIRRLGSTVVTEPNL